jgi:hypothetical protein
MLGRRDLAHQRCDLLAAEGILGHRTSLPRADQAGGLARGEIEGVGLLLVQRLNETIESGHGASRK